MIGYEIPIDEIKSHCEPSKTVIRLELFKGETILAQNLYYFLKPKDLSLEKAEIKFVVTATGDSGTIELSAKHLAKNVFLDTPGHEAIFSDNYFDLLPGFKKTIRFRSPSSEEMQKQLIIRTVSDTY